MKQPIYRAISTRTNHWVYGDLIRGDKYSLIVTGVIDSTEEYVQLESWEPVKNETICRFSGRNDVNGQPVFEGDWTIDQNGDVLEVSYSENFCSFIRQWTGGHELLYTTPWIKVVGNIYENKPSMLKS